MCSGANEVRKVKCMSDLISREAVIKAMENNSYMVEVYGTKTKIIDRMMMCCEIAELPTIEAVPVVHGSWERTDITEDEDGWALYRCSCCDWHTTCYYSFSASPTYNFCPNCGAKMDGGE